MLGIGTTRRLINWKSVWNFWKKKQATIWPINSLKMQNISMHTVFIQPLRDIDNAPSWQLPIMYQLALCEEKVGYHADAMETYSSIEEYGQFCQGSEGGHGKQQIPELCIRYGKMAQRTTGRHACHQTGCESIRNLHCSQRPSDSELVP